LIKEARPPKSKAEEKKIEKKKWINLLKSLLLP